MAPVWYAVCALLAIFAIASFLSWRGERNQHLAFDVGWSDPKVEPEFLARVASEPAIQECHHITGVWNYLLKVRVKNTKMLEAFLAKVIKTIDGVQRTDSLIVLSSPKSSSVIATELPNWFDSPDPRKTRDAAE